jgi:hypothetical protein
MDRKHNVVMGGQGRTGDELFDAAELGLSFIGGLLLGSLFGVLIVVALKAWEAMG